jgi:peptidylprolyl isomerase
MPFVRSTMAAALLSVAHCSPAAPTSVSAPVAIDVSAPSASASAVRVLPSPSPPATGETHAVASEGEKLVITVIASGSGPEAKTGDVVEVNYVGTLVDGTVFDSTTKAGRGPFRFKLGLGMVIKGWEQGVVGMKVGEQRRLVIPPALAYGERGRPPTIPAGASLVFDVEMLAINPP